MLTPLSGMVLLGLHSGSHHLHTMMAAELMQELHCPAFRSQASWKHIFVLCVFCFMFFLSLSLHEDLRSITGCKNMKCVGHRAELTFSHFSHAAPLDATATLNVASASLFAAPATVDYHQMLTKAATQYSSHRQVRT